jgi:hypothetical protein
MRWLLAFLSVVVVAGAACSGGSGPLPRVSTDCGGTPCVRVVPQLDSDGAPLNGATVMIAFDRPVKLSGSTEVAVVNAVMNLETRQPEVGLAGVRGIRVDPRSNGRQVQVDVDALLADGAAIAFGPGVLLAKDGGKPLPLTEAKLSTAWTPMAVAMARVVWDPTDRSLFSYEGTQKPRGATDERSVRAELEGRLRIRPGISDEQVNAVLARFDDGAAKAKVADHRLRAGLMLLTGTSAEYAIDFILADTNRRGVPFEPIKVESLSDIGAFAAVGYHPLGGKLRMYFDPVVVADTLENIAVVFSHETLHSSLGGGSGTEETLAMASDTRVYEELLLWDPALALNPTNLTREENQLLLAIRNSGRWGFPRAGLMPRPGVDDALRGTGKEPARSFKDLLFKPHFYGEIPKAGDTGSEVIEAYYKRISGKTSDQGHLRFDETTLKLYDLDMDTGFTDEQIFAIVDALKLKPTPIGAR